MTYHETDEELERRELAIGHEARTEPEDERDDKEGHRLRQGVDEVTVDRRPVRGAERLLETLAVQPQAVGLASERRDGADGTSGLASKLSGLLVRTLVLLILQNDDPKTDEASGEQHRRAGEGNETDFPREDKTDDSTADETRNGLNDRAEGDTSETVDLLRVVTEARGELAGIVLVLVEVLDVLPEDRAEAERTDLVRQLGSGRSEEVVLQANGKRRQDGDEEEPTETESASFSIRLIDDVDLPEGDAITIMPPHVRVCALEAVDTLGIDDTERRVRSAVACNEYAVSGGRRAFFKSLLTNSSDRAEEVPVPILAIDGEEATEDRDSTILAIRLFGLLLVALVEDLGGERPPGLRTREWDLLLGSLLVVLLFLGTGDVRQVIGIVSTTLLARITELLSGNEAGVWAVLVLEQLLMRARLEEQTVAHDVDAVCVLDRRQTVSNRDRRTASSSLVQSVLHDTLTLGVQGGRGLIQKEDLRVGDDSASDGDTLLLTTGKQEPALTDHGLVA